MVWSKLACKGKKEMQELKEEVMQKGWVWKLAAEPSGLNWKAPSGIGNQLLSPHRCSAEPTHFLVYCDTLGL